GAGPARPVWKPRRTLPIALAEKRGKRTMLMPKRVKHRKVHRGKRGGVAQRGNTVAFGEYGLQALEAGWVDSRQIESARRTITRHIKRGGKVWIRILPDKPVTAK